MGLDEGVKVIPPIIVGDLIAGLDILDRCNEDFVLLHVALGVRPARMIDVARNIAAAGAVDRPAAVDLEQIFGPELVGLLGRDQPAGIISDELALLDRLDRKQAQAGFRAADTISAARRPPT